MEGGIATLLYVYSIAVAETANIGGTGALTMTIDAIQLLNDSALRTDLVSPWTCPKVP